MFYILNIVFIISTRIRYETMLENIDLYQLIKNKMLYSSLDYTSRLKLTFYLSNGKKICGVSTNRCCIVRIIINE